MMYQMCYLKAEMLHNVALTLWGEKISSRLHSNATWGALMRWDEQTGVKKVRKGKRKRCILRSGAWGWDESPYPPKHTGLNGVSQSLQTHTHTRRFIPSSTHHPCSRALLSTPTFIHARVHTPERTRAALNMSSVKRVIVALPQRRRSQCDQM